MRYPCFGTAVSCRRIGGISSSGTVVLPHKNIQLVVSEEERCRFYERYLNEPSIRAFESGIREVLLPCLVKLPDFFQGRYVQFKVNLVETPDTGDITGILTITDITEKTIQNRIIRMLSSLNYDLVADVDLMSEQYKIVSGGDLNIKDTQGSLRERVRRVVEELVVDTEKTYVKDMLVTERKAKYDLEKALSEAEKASRVKSDFLSSMSHDIRMPMNAIVGMTTLAQADLFDVQKVEDYLKKIFVSSQHFLSLINDVLDMSQIEQSKLHMIMQPLHIDELLDQIGSIMASPSKDAGLDFTIERGKYSIYIFREMHYASNRS